MTRRAKLLLVLFPVFSMACAASAGTEDAASSDDDLTYARTSPKWIYAGLLPSLESPSITVSLASHTARVTGLLPDDFAGDLPFYAVETPDGERRRVTVVYPVATGAHTNGPGSYDDLRGLPYVVTNPHAEWGGFPYLEYNHPRGLALHGPITHADHEWRLLRGPVSHGCNRMQGEHVVEVAQLVGIDMSRPHVASDVVPIEMPVTVTTALDTFEGQPVDVDYPAMPEVVRASGARMFATWSSDDFPTFVCAYDATRPLGASYCDAVGPNRKSPTTGL